MSDNFKAVLLALTGFGIFATHDVIIKTLGATYSTFQIIFFTVLLGFPLVTLMLLRDTTVDTLIPKHPWMTALRTLLSVVAAAGAFFAFANLPLAQTYAILFASPLLITVLSIPILGELVGWRRLVAVGVGLLGVLVVLQPGTTELSWGHIAALVSAVAGAMASVIMRKIGREERSVVLILYPMVANFVVMAAALPFVYVPMPLMDLGLIFVVSAFALVAMTCMIAAYRLGQAVIVAPMQYSQILWATGYGALLFGENLSVPTIIGAGIIIASGIYIVFREDSVSENTPVLRTRSRLGTPGAPRVSTLMKHGDKPQLPE